VTQTAASNEPAAFGISAKMARALTDTWRFRILSELSVRPLSPSQFVDEVGGELTHVSRCFRQLANWGYVEILEERPGRRQGAAVEHVYRAIQRAHFDTSSWRDVPHLDRHALSISVLESYFERITEAISAGTFDDELDRHLSWDGVVLDRIAWTQLTNGLDRVLDWLPELEVEAAKRKTTTEGEAIPVIVGLTAFRSPQPAGVMLGAPRRQVSPTIGGTSSFVLSPKMARALSNKWRSRILMELSARPMSPSQFVEQIGGSMTHISRCFRQLAEWGFAEVVEERKGGRHGGGVERVYRNTKRAHFDTPTWETLPRFLRNEVSRSFLDSYLARITEAIEAGTLDAETERHLSWTPIVLDRFAWIEITTALDKILDWLPQLEVESFGRLKDTDAEQIPTTVGLTAFRSPAASKIG
jgi:DNA-binding transcriptional regulator GbsR (MarR family)